jgi:hypothetical protein
MYRSSSWILGEEEGLSRDLTGHSSGRQSDGCGRAARSGSGDDLSSGESEFLCNRNPNAVVDYEAPGPFYRSKEGGETVPWR